jgi:catechol 2,3-dioxygenase-like lactoylglutathione lyase family enzyme
MEQLPEGGDQMVLDHIGFAVTDYQRSKAFYEKALAPLGFTLLMEFSEAAAGFGRDDGGRPSFFIEADGEPARGRLHIALSAETRSTASPTGGYAGGRGDWLTGGAAAG